ncbi:CU044_2847 family protein [Streptomyces sp. NPDC004250]|uniref:CU044_2847 family protein n=1 Tax=Streptomyces sp. NPDC004250 TaxID=3364692 RepID=UPI003693AC3A
MGDVTLTFDDGSVAHLHVVPARAETAGPDRTGGGNTADSSPGPGPGATLELPDGFGTARPVSVDERAAHGLTRGGEALTRALRPLGGVLSGIHQSFAQSRHRPDEVTVEFGVTLGSDLSIGVFSGTGEASFTVSATWNLADTGNGGEPDSAPPVPSQAQPQARANGQANGS